MGDDTRVHDARYPGTFFGGACSCRVLVFTLIPLDCGALTRSHRSPAAPFNYSCHCCLFISLRRAVSAKFVLPCTVQKRKRSAPSTDVSDSSSL